MVHIGSIVMFFVVFYVNVILHYPVLLLTTAATNYDFDYCLTCQLFSFSLCITFQEIVKNCSK